MTGKTFTIEEVKEHNTRGNLWMVIQGKVYDCSKFLDDHPGGEEVLIEQAGLDATEAFDEIGHSDDARDLLKEMYLGDLIVSEASATLKSATTAAQMPKKETTSSAAQPQGYDIMQFPIVLQQLMFIFIPKSLMNQFLNLDFTPNSTAPTLVLVSISKMAFMAHWRTKPDLTLYSFIFLF
ncbi:hypothetical protein BDV3_000373 [Batrachochytrium dendrobatidis]